MQKAPPTPKGFRDIPPELAKKRRDITSQIVGVLEELGFVPIETPVIEFADTLTGKYGEDEKLIYKFQDRGGRDLALRYDLTVPFARFITSNLSLVENHKAFSRYQIGQVFRGENPQAGRFREFTQIDFDTAGSSELEEDAKIIAGAVKSARKIGLKEAIIAVNDRENFEKIPLPVIRAYDKIHKIKKEGVIEELKSQDFKEVDIENYLQMLINSKPTENLKKIFAILEEKHNLKIDHEFFFDSSLARGLDYYTGAIYELKSSFDLASLSIGAGGRYDNLIGNFLHPAQGDTGEKIPSVGFSFGLDRLIEAL